VPLPNGEGGYGYEWWIRAHGYSAEGYGGQYVYVVPSDHLVVVLTADPYAAQHIDIGSFELLLDDVLSAIHDRG
jgi:CubicO group peptidase (beta-lactamase class C family)